MPTGKATSPRKKNPRFDVLGCRTQLGLTQEELAKKLLVNWRTVLRWERAGIKPHRRMVWKMRELLKGHDIGLTPERPATVPPIVRRKLPTVTAGIGIAPSSF